LALTEQAYEDGTLDRSFTVKDIMDTWTLKKGYPVVNIDRTKSTEITISQKWFLVNPLNTVQNNLTEYNKYKWYVPFTYTTKNVRDFNFESKTTWLKPTDTESKTK
jgi:aminopeptidase N